MKAERAIGVALIGTGRVAKALCERIDRLQRQGALAHLVLRGIANSRGQWRVPGGAWGEALSEAENWPRRASDRERMPETRAEWEVLIDTSDADSVAALHPEWLAAGRVVVTANKRGLGASFERAERVMTCSVPVPLTGPLQPSVQVWAPSNVCFGCERRGSRCGHRRRSFGHARPRARPVERGSKPRRGAR